MSQGNLGMSGALVTNKRKAPKPHKVRTVRIPGIGRVALTRDLGDGRIFGMFQMETHLEMLQRRDGHLIAARDLGSGKVTNVGVLAMANSAAWAAPSAEAMSVIAKANWHAWGETAAEAATDIEMSKAAAPTTANAVAGTQTVSLGEYTGSASQAEYKTAAVITAGGSITIAEWGLFLDKELSATTGSPLTAKSATTATVTGTPFTASSATVRGQQMKIIVFATAKVYGLILSNTTSVVTVPAWFKTDTGKLGAEPGATEAYKLQPVMWDHKKFTGLGVETNDTIEFKYSLLVNSGG